MISRALESEPDKRASMDEMMNHAFLAKAAEKNNPVPPCLQLTQVIKKYTCKFVFLILLERKINNRLSKALHQQSSSVLDSMASSMFMSSDVSGRGGAEGGGDGTKEESLSPKSHKEKNHGEKGKSMAKTPYGNAASERSGEKVKIEA